MAKFNDAKWRRDVLNGKITMKEGLKHNDMYNMLDIAAGFTSNAHQAASRMWYDAQDLYDYIKSDHIRSNKDRKAFYKAIKRSFPMVKENFIREGVEQAWIIKKDVGLKYVSGHSSAVNMGLMTADHSGVIGKKGAFVVVLPGGHFLVDTKRKLAMAIAHPKRQPSGWMNSLKSIDPSKAPQFRDWRSYWKR